MVLTVPLISSSLASGVYLSSAKNIIIHLNSIRTISHRKMIGSEILTFQYFHNSRSKFGFKILKSWSMNDDSWYFYVVECSFYQNEVNTSPMWVKEYMDYQDGFALGRERFRLGLYQDKHSALTTKNWNIGLIGNPNSKFCICTRWKF